MSQPAKLTLADLRRHFRDAEADDRAVMAHQICRSIEKAELTAAEREKAESLVRLMAADLAEKVRLALAVTLKHSTLVPRDVAVTLARDIDAIAAPILSASPALTDDDLIEILRGGEPVRQIAVARRPTLGRRVTGAMAIFGVEAAVVAACANDNAEFAEIALQRVLDRYPTSQQVAEAMASRPQLPISVAERLAAAASEVVRAQLQARHSLRAETARRLSVAVRERMTVDLIDEAAAGVDYPTFVGQLHRGGRLNASLLLRALGRGQATFFEHGLAHLSGVPHARAWLMVHDGGPLGFRAIYERAGLPARLFPAFRAALDAWRSVQAEGRLLDPADMQGLVLERFLTSHPLAPREDVDYLLDRLDQSDARTQGRRADAA